MSKNYKIPLNSGVNQVDIKYFIIKYILRTFYPKKGAAKAEPKVVQLFLLMFYPPKGDTQYLTRGPIDTLSIYWG